METMTLWRWVEMIAQLDDDSMEYVVEGQSNEITAAAGCSLRPRLNSYDHQRHHMLRVGGRPAENKLRIRDFVIHRSDGSEIRLHPQWKRRRSKPFVQRATTKRWNRLGRASVVLMAQEPTEDA